MAIHILQSRMPLVSRAVPDEELGDLPAEAVAAVRELVATAHIRTDIRWPDPASLSDESPF